MTTTVKEKIVISICSHLYLAAWLRFGTSPPFHMHTWEAQGRGAAEVPHTE